MSSRRQLTWLGAIGIAIPLIVGGLALVAVTSPESWKSVLFYSGLALVGLGLIPLAMKARPTLRRLRGRWPLYLAPPPTPDAGLQIPSIPGAASAGIPTGPEDVSGPPPQSAEPSVAEAGIAPGEAKGTIELEPWAVEGDRTLYVRARNRIRPGRFSVHAEILHDSARHVPGLAPTFKPAWRTTGTPESMIRFDERGFIMLAEHDQYELSLLVHERHHGLRGGAVFPYQTELSPGSPERIWLAVRVYADFQDAPVAEGVYSIGFDGIREERG